MSWDIVTAELAHAFGRVGTTSLYASVLITLVFAIQLAFGKRLPARLSYVLGLLVLLRLMLPVVPASRMSVFNLSRSVAAQPIRREVPLAITSKQSVLAQPSTASAELSALAESPKPDAGIGLPVVAGAVWLAGLALSLLLVGRQHWKFFHRITRDPAIEEERVRALLDECRAMMGVKRELRVVVTPQLTTPALFGWFRPRLLLPEGTLQRLDEHELRMVFLHELAHMKRGDILLNWIMIVVRSLHWFNPLVWLAVRRLRTDRELVCDAMVLSRLGVEEHRSYGNTLIKLLDEFSEAGFCPSLAPVINHRQEIKRRVTMIAEFKPISRIVLLLSAATIVALSCFTFTRAAEKTAESAENEKRPAQTEANDNSGQAQASLAPGLEMLKRRLDEQNEMITKAQKRLDQLRRDRRIPDSLAESDSFAEARNSGSTNPETVRQLESAKVNAESERRRLGALLKSLKARSESELENVIDVAVPDELLTSLLKSKAECEQKLASLGTEFGPDMMNVKATREELNKIAQQIKARTAGIMAGLQVKLDATDSQIELLTSELDRAKAEDAETMAKLRPYFDEKRNLENIQKVRDAILLRILQETVDMQIPKQKLAPVQ